jgi:hypothetical protein
VRPAAVFLLWGALLAVILLAGLIFFGFPDPETPALFGASVAVMAILAALIAVRRWDAIDEEYLRSHPDVSPPVAWLGVSFGLLAYSLEVGWWLSLIAAGMVVVGLAGVVRERRAERRALRAAREDRR